VAAATLEEAPVEPSVPACEPLEIEVPEVPMGKGDAPVPPIVHDETLAPFLEKVARLLRGKAADHIRIAVYGDSNLTMDFLTGQLRRALQLEHGDAGHGFVALGRPWSHYKHMDVRHGVKGNITSYACSTTPTVGHVYGISGIAGESTGVGGKAWAATVDGDAPIGHEAGRFTVFYEKGDKRGTFDIRADGETIESVDSHASETGLGVERFELPDGPHEVAVVATDRRRRVRFLGLSMERDVPPSFVVDSFGVGSMNTHAQHRQDPDINHAMLKERGYDLIVFATGANDVFSLDTTPKELGELIARQRAALPDAPIVLFTPSDRGRESTFPQTLDVVKQRYELAEANGVALWDLFEAMGGENSMGAFKKRGFAIFDHIHMTQAGGAYLADRFRHALWTSLAHYVKAHPEAGCAAPEAPADDATPAGEGIAASSE
jgi:lysophospholipase L1-like esterase